MLKILCLIPARSGSKGIPHKNTKLLADKPLLAWTIEQAQKSKYPMKIIVSTDSTEYMEIAKKYGAEVPFLRPKEISQDLSTDFEFINHSVNWLAENEKYIPDIIVQLRPTQPCRKIEDIDKCLETFINIRNTYDSLRTVIPIEKTPFKMYTVDSEKKLLQPLFKEVNSIKEPYNQCRQVLPTCYVHNGYIDVFNTAIIKQGTISGENIYPYIMNKEDVYDIDTLEDWEKVNNFILKNKIH